MVVKSRRRFENDDEAGTSGTRGRRDNRRRTAGQVENVQTFGLLLGAVCHVVRNSGAGSGSFAFHRLSPNSLLLPPLRPVAVSRVLFALATDRRSFHFRIAQNSVICAAVTSSTLIDRSF